MRQRRRSCEARNRNVSSSPDRTRGEVALFICSLSVHVCALYSPAWPPRRQVGGDGSKMQSKRVQ